AIARGELGIAGLRLGEELQLRLDRALQVADLKAIGGVAGEKLGAVESVAKRRHEQTGIAWVGLSRARKKLARRLEGLRGNLLGALLAGELRRLHGGRGAGRLQRA